MTAQVLNGALLRIPLGQVEPGPNARGDVGDVTELAASMRTLGQQIPVTVERLAGDRWQLVDGHRRHAAARKAGMPHLDAIVRGMPDGPVRLLRQLAIQAGSRRFDPMAEAAALHSLMFEHGLTREQIAVHVGRSSAWVRDRIALVHLEPDEQVAVERGHMSVGEATLRLQSRRSMRAGAKPAPGSPCAVPKVPDRTNNSAAATTTSPLTRAQAQVLQLVADGNRYDEIAQALDITAATVKSHATAMYEALGARNAAHAVHLAYQSGLLTVGEVG